MRVGVDIDSSVVIEDGALYDWQSETHTSRLRCAEGGKNLVFQVGCNSPAVVVNRDHYSAGTGAVVNGLGSQSDSGLRPSERGLSRIRDQVRV